MLNYFIDYLDAILFYFPFFHFHTLKLYLWRPTLEGKGLLKFCRCSWSKEMTKVRGSTKIHKVIIVNYILGMEIGIS